MCWPHDQISGSIPHVENATVAGRFAAAKVLLAHNDLAFVQEEMLQEQDLGVDSTQ